MKDYIEIISNLFKSNFVHSIIVIIVSFFIYKIVKHFFIKGNAVVSEKLNNKSKTYLRLITSILRYVFVIITILIILEINGINVSSMLAGVGIISVILGLAIQDALKDIIRGFSILSDGYFSVGDVVSYDGIVGKTIVIGLKTTKIKDLSTNNIISIANRNIEKIQVVSEDIYINIPLSYELSIDKAENVIDIIINEIKTNDDVKNAEYLGVNSLDDSNIKYLIKVMCDPEIKLKIRRFSLGCILRVLENEEIEVPYNQLDIHQK